MDEVAKTMHYGESLIGRLIDGRFKITRPLGAGAMGEIYLAKQVPVDVPRAIKVIKTDLKSDDQAEARFRREALALSRLQHTNIVQILDFGRLADEALFIVMEYIDGPDVEQIMKEQGPFPLEDAVVLLQKIAGALDYAHRQQVVHRDLKPANLLLHERDVRQVKLVDFGLVKVLSGTGATQITADQQILGTPMFMAPEQCGPGEVGPPADIYAFGGIGYHLISGRPVFSARSIPAMIIAQISQPPERLRLRCPDIGIPSALDDLLLRCLEKEPGQRPSASEAADLLDEVAITIKQRQLSKRRETAPTARTSDLPDPVAVLASSIWPDRDPLAAAGEESEERWMCEGLQNQITTAVTELAQELQFHLNLTASINIQLAQIQRIETTLSDLQMEAALMDSRISEQAAPADVSGAETERRRAIVESQARELGSSLVHEYRALFQYVMKMRSQITAPFLLDLFAELDELAERYVAACGDPG